MRQSDTPELRAARAMDAAAARAADPMEARMHEMAADDLRGNPPVVECLYCRNAVWNGPADMPGRHLFSHSTWCRKRFG